jgi:hypothetical protein
MGGGLYIDEQTTCLRDYIRVNWLVDHEQGYCFQPLIFWYLDIDKRAGISPAFPYDANIWGWWTKNPHPLPWDKLESVTPANKPAGTRIHLAESVTGESIDLTRKCAVCGREINWKRRHAATCSPKCRKTLSRRKSA